MIMTMVTAMRIPTIMIMPIDPVQTLSQWFSPGYPLGSFAYSHGLETAIQDGRITTAQDAERWLGDLLEYGTGRADAALVQAAYRCGDLLAAKALDAEARAFCASAERLWESAQQGAAFARTTQEIWGIELPPLTHPVAVGYAAGQLALPAELTATLYLQAFVANLVSCAVRLVPLGQTEGQAVLHCLAPLCTRIAAQSKNEGLDGLVSTSFVADIAAMHHETITHRIFRT